LGRRRQKVFNYAETFLISLGVVFLLIVFATKMTLRPSVIGGALDSVWKGQAVGGLLAKFTNHLQQNVDSVWVVSGWGVLGALALAIILGFLANPNVLSMHGVLKERILQAFLGAADERAPDRHLASLAGRALESTSAGPYPLVGGCLSVLGEPDPAFTGANGSDYFLFSPLFCGAKLTGYASTRWPRYSRRTLGDALACSAASVNPVMGSHSSTLLTLLGILFNLRLGVWMWNPRRPRWRYPTFWPIFTVFELLKMTDTRRDLLSVSDGGFIENLGVFELLRRRCKVILAIDNTYDPNYQFGHLRNLIVRAQQELGLELKNDQAFDQLSPSAITGLADKQFVVFQIRSDPHRTDPPYSGVLIYAKASLSHRLSYVGRSSARSGPSAYRTYNPKFPQDTTVDQFFDKSQWQAYFQLGSEIASSVTTDADVLEAIKRLDVPMPRLAQLFGLQPGETTVPKGQP
jgi:hypothetical protein